MGRIGYESYQLTNNNANIARVRGRIEELGKMKAGGHQEREYTGDVKVVEDPDAARIRIHFPGKPDAAAIAKLKAGGFRWSPSEGAWQRHLNNGGKYATESMLKGLGHQEVPKAAAPEQAAPEAATDVPPAVPMPGLEEVDDAGTVGYVPPPAGGDAIAPNAGTGAGAPTTPPPSAPAIGPDHSSPRSSGIVGRAVPGAAGAKPTARDKIAAVKERTANRTDEQKAKDAAEMAAGDAAMERVAARMEADRSPANADNRVLAAAGVKPQDVQKLGLTGVAERALPTATEAVRKSLGEDQPGLAEELAASLVRHARVAGNSNPEHVGESVIREVGGKSSGADGDPMHPAHQEQRMRAAKAFVQALRTANASPASPAPASSPATQAQPASNKRIAPNAALAGTPPPTSPPAPAIGPDLSSPRGSGSGRVVPSMQANPAMLDTAAVAKHVQVAPRTVSKWVDQGMLPGERDATTGNRSVSPQDLAAFMLRHNMALPAELASVVPTPGEEFDRKRKKHEPAGAGGPEAGGPLRQPVAVDRPAVGIAPAGGGTGPAQGRGGDAAAGVRGSTSAPAATPDADGPHSVEAEDYLNDEYHKIPKEKRQAWMRSAAKGQRHPEAERAESAIKARHRAAVEAALTAGKPVPANVLAEYPDLAPKASPAGPAPAMRAAQGTSAGSNTGGMHRLATIAAASASLAARGIPSEAIGQAMAAAHLKAKGEGRAEARPKAATVTDPVHLNPANLKQTWEAHKAELEAHDTSLSPMRAGELAAARLRNHMGNRLADIESRTRSGNITPEEERFYDEANVNDWNFGRELEAMSGSRTMAADMDHPHVQRPLDAPPLADKATPANQRAAQLRQEAEAADARRATAATGNAARVKQGLIDHERQRKEASEREWARHRAWVAAQKAKPPAT
jgi:hypothetical protein